MSDIGRNGAGVSTSYVRASVPASEGPSSDEPPPYSVCVPNPPAIGSYYPETHSALLGAPPAYTSSKYLNNGSRTGNRVDEVRPSAPFLDVASTSGDPPGVHDPRIGSDNTQAARPTTEGNPPADRHQQKEVVLRRSVNNAHWPIIGASIKTFLISTVATISILIFLEMGPLSRKTRTSNHGNYKIPDIYRDNKINADLTDRYKNDLHRFDFGDRTKTDLFNFDEVRRAMEKHVDDALNAARKGRRNETRSDTGTYRSLTDRVKDIINKYAHKDLSITAGKTGINPNLDHQDDADGASIKPKNDIDVDLKLPDFLDLSKSLPSQFGNQKRRDPSREIDVNRIVKRFRDILGVDCKAKSNEDVRKSGKHLDSASTIIPDSDESDLSE